MFGLFNRKKRIPAPENERVAFVRSLVYLRSEQDPQAGSIFTMMGTSVEDLDDMILMNLPEASILRLVEQYTTAREQGADDETIIPFLSQSHAMALSQAGQDLPMVSEPYTLPNYLRHFIDYVHPQGAPVSDDFIRVGIQKVREFYGR